MHEVDLDRQLAAAEAQLDRVDDGDELDVDVEELELADGMHVEDGDGSWASSDGDDEGHVVAIAQDAMDELCEAFNARDLDAVLDLCAEDCEFPGLASDVGDVGDALDEMWERRPSLTLTRAVHDDAAVGVLWERGDTTGWAAIAVLHADTDEDGVIGVLELTEDPTLLDVLDADAPDSELEEGARWEEWDEGVE